MLSWRTPGHPQAGGAESLTHEILRRAVERGHSVTWRSASWPGAAATDELDGIAISRSGRQWTVHARAWPWARRRLSEFDVVVDQINTIPFFTPLWVPRVMRRMFIFQTAREYWWRQTRGLFRLIAPIGYLLEPWYLRTYRRTRAITISGSTRDELIALGFPRDAVVVLPMAADVPVTEPLPEKDWAPSVVVIGRLEPAKNVEESIEAFAGFQAAEPEATLEIVGAGAPDYREKLERFVRKLGLQGVTFHGRVSEQTKQEILARAWLHVFCSHREGWGLTVTEAAAVGTPSVGYDVPGVRDSIADPRMLGVRKDPASLAALMTRLRGDRATYDEVRLAAWERARTASLEATADRFLEALDA